MAREPPSAGGVPPHNHRCSLPFIMGKHLSAAELDSVQAWRSQGTSVLEIHRRLQRARATDGGDGPNLSTVRKALRGISHRRGMVETRGRKRILSPVSARALDAARKRLIAKTDGQYDVHVFELLHGPLCNNYVTTM